MQYLSQEKNELNDKMYLWNWIFFSLSACCFIIRIPTSNIVTRMFANVHEELRQLNFKTEKAKTCVAAKKLETILQIHFSLPVNIFYIYCSFQFN